VDSEAAPSRPGVLTNRLLTGSVLLFAAAAPWSIALAQIGVVAAAGLWVVSLRLPGFPRNPLPWTLVLVLVYLGAQALSIPLGVHPARSLRCFQGSWVLLFVFVFWFALADPSRRRPALRTLAVSGALAGLYAIVQFFQGIDWIHGQRLLERYGEGGFVAVGTLSSHLTFAGVELPLFFLAFGLAMDRKGTARALGLALAATIGLGLLFTFTRSAWIGAAGGLLVFGALRGKKATATAIALLALVATISLLANADLSHRMLSIFQLEQTPRWRLWRTALAIVADHPVTGAGLGSFKTLFPVYKVPGAYMSTVHPHHDFLNALVETGMIGGLAWIGIWVAFFRETRGPVQGAGRRASWTSDSMRAAVAALLVAGLGQCYFTDEEVAQVWWFLAAATFYEAGWVERNRGTVARRASRAFKRATLPLAARLFASRRSPLAVPVLRAGRPPRLLVVRQDNRLGNLILLTPFLRRLREANPEARIGMVISDLYAPLLRGWPWVDQWIVQEKRRHIRRPWEFPLWLARMRRDRWDVAFEMSNYNTHSYYNCLLTLASGAPLRAGFEEPRNRGSLNRTAPAPDPRMPFSLTPLELLRVLGWPAEPAEIACPFSEPPSARFRAWFVREGLDVTGKAGDPYAVIHVGGRGDKAWPRDAWERLLQAATERYPGRFVLVAGPGERDRLPVPPSSPDDRICVAPALEILDLACLLQGATGYVGCDSGVLHLAAATGTSTVSLFFRSNPYHYGPLGERHRVVLLANPYGVEEAIWDRPAGPLPRARLLRADRDPVASAAGIPETGPAAIETVAGALLEISAAPALATALRGSGRARDETEATPPARKA
jgi:heptosyltransferase-3